MFWRRDRSKQERRGPGRGEKEEKGGFKSAIEEYLSSLAAYLRNTEALWNMARAPPHTSRVRGRQPADGLGLAGLAGLAGGGCEGCVPSPPPSLACHIRREHRRPVHHAPVCDAVVCEPPATLHVGIASSSAPPRDARKFQWRPHARQSSLFVFAM